MIELATALTAAAGTPVEVRHVEPVTGGAQRDTAFLDVVVDGRPRSWVLSVQRARIDGIPMTVEVACLRAARAAEVRAPAVVAATDDISLLGGPFMVTERRPGEAIGRRVQRLAAGDDGLGERVIADLGHDLARLHRDAEPPVGLERLDGPAYVVRLRAEFEELPRPSAPVAAGLAWLADDPPTMNEPVLVHGDLRIGNVVVDPSGLTAIIDWELAHLGDPMEDLAWASVRTWRYGRTPEVGGLAGLDVLVGAYEEAGGTFDRDRFEWWRIARTVWWCLGLGRQAGAWMDGRSTSLVHAASGRRVAEIEWDLLDLLEDAVG